MQISNIGALVLPMPYYLPGFLIRFLRRPNDLLFFLPVRLTLNPIR
jgi:hypothetical protein